MTGRKKKAQISVYLDFEVMSMLGDYASRRDQPMSMIVEAAIASFLSPDAAERREAAIARRLDQLDRRMSVSSAIPESPSKRSPSSSASG